MTYQTKGIEDSGRLYRNEILLHDHFLTLFPQVNHKNSTFEPIFKIRDMPEISWCILELSW